MLNLSLIHIYLGIDHETLEDKYPRVFEQPFDSDRKRMTTVHVIDEKITAYTKGAVDEILPVCSHILTSGGIREMDAKDRLRINQLCESMSENALRVLGFSMRIIPAIPDDDDTDFEDSMIFIGAVGMIDPPRSEVAESVRTCRRACLLYTSRCV